MNIKPKTPSMCTLITTYQCTSSCPNCCFNCSPKKDRIMTREEVMNYIDMTINEFPSIKTVVFTGGECSLMGWKNLADSIEYAANKNLRTRIVTNGHWGTNFKRAKYILEFLSNKGLNEVNLSTGDEHSQFVSLNKIFNIIVANQSVKKLSTILVNVEDLSSHILTRESVKMKFKEYIIENNIGDEKKVIFISSPWCDFKKVKIRYDEDEFSNTLSNEYNILSKGCNNIFTSVNINNEGQLLSCCGLAAEYSPLLKLGNVNHKTIGEIYNSQFEDLFKIWLYTSGPEKIISYLEKKAIVKKEKNHQCAVCLRLLLNPKYIQQILEMDKKEIIPEVFKYHLNNFF